MVLKTIKTTIMDNWYLPMTITPAIGLIILSTSNMLLNLNGEISELDKDKVKNEDIIRLKLLQLKKLSISIVCQYIGLFLFFISGILKASILDSEILFNYLLLGGVTMVTISIFILLIYSLKAVAIRQQHLKI